MMRTEVNVTAVFDYSPKNDIRTGDSVDLDASSSLPQDGSLTYSWDCDGDGATDKTGQQVSCSWEIEGTYSVTLTVVSGSKSSSQTKTIEVLKPQLALQKQKSLNIPMKKTVYTMR